MTATLYSDPVTDSPPDDDRLDVNDVAVMIDRSVDHTRSLLRDGVIPAELVRGIGYRVRLADVRAYLDRRPARADTSTMNEALGRLADDIAAAQRRVDTLIEQRNRALVAWVDDHEMSVTAAAKAARLSRDRANTLLRIARAERPGAPGLPVLGP